MEKLCQTRCCTFLSWWARCLFVRCQGVLLPLGIIPHAGHNCLWRWRQNMDCHEHTVHARAPSSPPPLTYLKCSILVHLLSRDLDEPYLLLFYSFLRVALSIVQENCVSRSRASCLLTWHWLPPTPPPAHCFYVRLNMDKLGSEICLACLLSPIVKAAVIQHWLLFPLMC